MSGNTYELQTSSVCEIGFDLLIRDVNGEPQVSHAFDLPLVGKSLNQCLKLGTNNVRFFIFRDMRFNLEKIAYQKHFYFNENKH